MKSIQELLKPEQLKKDYSDYTIIDPLLFAPKLNRLLRSTEFRREAHRCCVAADAVKRWEVLEHFGFDRYPEPRRPLEGEQFLLPWQVVTLDWDWDLGPGRRPIYHQFVMPSLCHWRASLDLMLARRLMPDFDWVVVSAERHTAVMAPAEQLIWDMSYFALDVSAQDALETMFGDDLTSQDYELFEEEYAFSRNTVELIHIWDLIDGYSEDKRLSVIQGMGGQLDELRSQERSAEPELLAA